MDKNNTIGSTTNLNKLVLIIIGWFALGMTAQAASFDCAKAATKVEKLVCANPEISKLDDTLGKAYQDNLTNADEEQKQLLITEQKHWLKHTRNVCSDETCLKLAYWSRQAELATFFEPKQPLYQHEADKAEAIKHVLATAPLYLHGTVPGVPVAPNLCTEIFDGLKQMKGIRFIDPIVQTQSYEDPALDKIKQHCGAKPPLNFSYTCDGRFYSLYKEDIPEYRKDLSDVCNVGFGLPPFKVYELPPIGQTDKRRFIFYADDSYGPMNDYDEHKSRLGDGYSTGFKQIDPDQCELVESVSVGAGIGPDYGTFKRNRKNYNSIIEYKNQYYFLVLNNQASSWWLEVQTVTQLNKSESCMWSSVKPSKPYSSSQGSK